MKYRKQFVVASAIALAVAYHLLSRDSSYRHSGEHLTDEDRWVVSRVRESPVGGQTMLQSLAKEYASVSDNDGQIEPCNYEVRRTVSYYSVFDRLFGPEPKLNKTVYTVICDSWGGGDHGDLDMAYEWKFQSGLGVIGFRWGPIPRYYPP